MGLRSFNTSWQWDGSLKVSKPILLKKHARGIREHKTKYWSVQKTYHGGWVIVSCGNLVNRWEFGTTTYDEHLTVNPEPMPIISPIMWQHHMTAIKDAFSIIKNRMYKDYVYGGCLYMSTWKNKEYLRSKDKAKELYDVSRHILLHMSKYKHKWRYTIHYVKPTAQLLFKSRFPKGGPTCMKQEVNPRHQTSQGQSVAKPETPLHNIQIE